MLLGLDLLNLGHLGSGLVAQATTTPVPLDLLAALVVVGLNGLDQLGEGGSVVGLYVGDGNAGGGLASAHSAKPGLVLDNAVGDSHLPAEGWQEHDKLNGVNIIGDHHKLSFLLLNQGGHSVDTMADNCSALSGCVLLASSPGSCALPKPLLLGLLGLWPVLVHQLEQLGGSLTVQGGVELVNRWGNLKTGLKDNLLPLQTDVLGPLHEPGKVPGWLDVSSDAKVPAPLLEERVDHTLRLWPLDGKWRRGHLLSHLSLLGDHFSSLVEVNQAIKA